MLLLRQQRFYRGAGELLYAREGVRDAIDVLATDIRGFAVADTARLLADSAMEMFTSIGASVLCQLTSVTEAGLAPAARTGNSLVTRWDGACLLARQHRHHLMGKASHSQLWRAFAGDELSADIRVLAAGRRRGRSGGIWADSRDSPERQRSCRRSGEIHQARQI